MTNARKPWCRGLQRIERRIPTTAIRTAPDGEREEVARSRAVSPPRRRLLQERLALHRSVREVELIVAGKASRRRFSIGSTVSCRSTNTRPAANRHERGDAFQSAGDRAVDRRWVADHAVVRLDKLTVGTGRPGTPAKPTNPDHQVTSNARVRLPSRPDTARNRAGRSRDNGVDPSTPASRPARNGRSAANGLVAAPRTAQAGFSLHYLKRARSR